MEVLHEHWFSVWLKNRLSLTKVLFYFRNSYEQMLLAFCFHIKTKFT
ncbi:hypothetical protein BACUNI_02156 [Bacteroides uniformis ATCC 8492]|uniref:Uncharacterized protein n=1 Tax=Bacteroides uniformis (strain ATCC 8492 / DSM 6597 / CCUG 4942 / CIP 103695 / JCM 5828 / KCTC 5204 / NCTC 13054 / VPI 0061) TaxID=411479 RepID=A0ABC9NBH8_BACUC|nr:hypothetical protein BACUNI_02156 [Bacteroides uniformis ATCC 8492]